jgi:hypothetical protein
MNDDMTNVVMSSADWQRNEQRHLRREKRFVAIIVLLILLLVGSNISWLYAWMQYDYTSTTEEIIVEQDAKDGGNANYIGNDGDIINGLSESNNTKEDTNTP